ncbi:MAG: hypothetical protein ACTH4J_12615, partial [Vibrio toranzoniae]
ITLYHAAQKSITKDQHALVSILLSSPKAQASYLRFKSYINKGSGVLMGSMGSKFVAESFKP